MKLSKKVISLVLVVASIFAFSACSSNSNNSSSTGSSTSSAPKQLKFAYISPGLNNPFWKTVANGVQAQCDAEGIELKIFDSNNDSNTQMKNAQDIITQKFDGLLLTPTDSNAAPAVLSAAKDANIPVVLINVGTFSGEYVSLIDAAEKQGGLSVGEYLQQQFKAQNASTDTVINEITISLARTNGQLRDGGYVEGLKEGGYSVKYTKQCELYTRDESYKFTQDMITAYPDMKALFCNFDEAALGAAKAIQDMGKSGQIILIGYDGSEESIAALKAGTIQAICLQTAAKQGKVGVSTLLDYINGKTVDKEIQIPTLLVTKDNVDQYTSMIQSDVFGN